MAANVGEEYSHLATIYGSEMAGKIAKFTLKNLECMRGLIKEFDVKESSEVQELRKLRVFVTGEKFEAFKESIERMERDHPSLKGIYSILDGDVVLKVFLFFFFWMIWLIWYLLMTDPRSMEFMALLEEHYLQPVQSGHIDL